MSSWNSTFNHYFSDFLFSFLKINVMRVVSSFGNQKYRSRDCQVVKRHRRMYLRSKLRPRFKLRQGRARMKKK